MPLFTIGISHHTAPIEVREKVAIPRDEISARIDDLLTLPGIEETLILGTCNRTEIYCLSSKGGPDTVMDWIYRTNAIPDGQLDGHIYAHEGEETARHLVRVASGLDSLVLGETQILGQLKDAWQQAHDSGSLGKVLDRLFQHIGDRCRGVALHLEGDDVHCLGVQGVVGGEGAGGGGDNAHGRSSDP